MTAYSPDPRDLAGRVPRSEADRLAELARRARYSRWDGTQRLPDLDADEILKALSDDVMAEVKALGGDGGVIMVTPKGDMVMSFNTAGMYRGKADASGRSVQIYADDAER